MVERIGQGGSLARAAIEAALARQAQSVQRMGEAFPSPGAAPASESSGFARAIADGVRAVDEQVKRADSVALDVATGGVAEFHEVAALVKQSELTLKFALEVRNKFIDAYREVMRMSV